MKATKTLMNLLTAATLMVTASVTMAQDQSVAPQAKATVQVTPVFNQFIQEVEARRFALTKWRCIKAQLKEINYSKSEIDQVFDALKEKKMDARSAEMFRSRWLEKYEESILPADELVSFLNGEDQPAADVDLIASR